MVYSCIVCIWVLEFFSYGNVKRNPTFTIETINLEQMLIFFNARMKTTYQVKASFKITHICACIGDVQGCVICHWCLCLCVSDLECLLFQSYFRLCNLLPQFNCLSSLPQKHLLEMLRLQVCKCSFTENHTVLPLISFK